MKKRLRDAYGNNSPRKNSHPGVGNQESNPVPDSDAVQNKKASSAFPRKSGDRNLLKSSMPAEEFLKVIRDSGSNNRPNLREIAGYLILIGKDKAAKILGLLPDDLVETILLEISRIKVLKPEENKKIFERFNIASILEQQRLRGGREFAQDLLERSLGRQKALQVLEKTVPAVGIDQLDFLNDLDPGQLRHLLKDEPPRLLGIILSHLSPGKAAALLRNLPYQLQIIKAMSEKVKLSQEVMHSIAKALKGKIRRIGNQQSQYIDGPQIMAEILRGMDATSERNLLEELGILAPEVEASIKERLFTIERVLDIRDVDLQKVLADLEDEEISLLMKGKDEKIRVRFLNNVSNQRSLSISEAYHFMGPVPRTDVDEATRDFILKLRRLEEAGEIIISREEDEMVE